MTRNDFRVEKVTGGYIVYCAFPFADYWAQQRKVITSLEEVVLLLRRYFDEAEQEGRQQ